jgi:hypothetical protein
MDFAELKCWMHPTPEVAARTFYLRCLWVVVRVALAYCFANEVSPFFYQRF